MPFKQLCRSMLGFAADPSQSWRLPVSGTPFSPQGNDTTATQSTRNEARLLSGTYSAEQFADYRRQLARVRERRLSMAFFPHRLPDSLAYDRVCAGCGKPFATCKADAERCYECCLRVLCADQPAEGTVGLWRRDEWTLELLGDPTNTELRFLWYPRKGGSRIHHQGLTVTRSPDGTVRRLVMATAAHHAKRCYSIIWDIPERTTQFVVLPVGYVCDDMALPGAEQPSRFEPLVTDLVYGMLPPFMRYPTRK